MSGILLGVVADDFTGASDAASFAVQGGLRTVLFNGVPGGKGREAANHTSSRNKHTCQHDSGY